MEDKNFGRLIELSAPLSEIVDALGEPPEGGRAAPQGSTLEGRHVKNVLTRYLAGSLSGDDVETWANEVERYMNLQFHPQEASAVQRALHTLANPTITKALTKELASELLGTLK